MSGKDDKFTVIQFRAKLDNIEDKLEDGFQSVKEDISGLRKGQENMWKQMRAMNNRQTRTETRLERCGTISDSEKDCPTTERLKRLESSGEKERDRGLTKLVIFVGLVATGLSLLVNVAFFLLSNG